MLNSIEDRDFILNQLRQELVGPAPFGETIDCSAPITFADAKASYPPRRQVGSGEEILQRDPPTARYGVGVLYPAGIHQTEEDEKPVPEGGRAESTDEQLDDLPEDKLEGDVETVMDRARRWTRESDSDDYDLAIANAFEASSMAVTFLAALPASGRLVVEAEGGRYRAKEVTTAGQRRRWYLRSPVHLFAEVPAESLQVRRATTIHARITESENMEGLDLQIEVLARPRVDKGTSLITVSLVNRTDRRGPKDESCLFQSHLRATVKGDDGQPHILPYPPTPGEKLDDEEQSLALLYRLHQTFAVGHGCAADWLAVEGDARAVSVTGECLPICETPSVTPEIRREDGSPVEVSMAALAGLMPDNDGMAALAEVVQLYEEWIRKREAEVDTLDKRYQDAALRHVDDCKRCLSRMQMGLGYLRDSRARRAFQLANHAVLLQQICTRRNRELRRAEYDASQNRLSFDHPYMQPDPLCPGDGVGQWRPFQIAFLLMTLRSSVDGEAPDRRTVELIWFPTGGGKTEAYLGLTAFTLFMRRLIDPTDRGVQVLMRYTLRLLTAQQFQRASGLITAMEWLRRDNNAELGDGPFSIGIWLGGSTTPNTREEARSTLRDLQKEGFSSENRLLVRQCPWCGAQMGPIETSRRSASRRPPVLGYVPSGKTIVFRCPDSQHCPFGHALPIFVIDEDIYEKRPSLVIGTVDKFAMLAWRPEARTLFGIDGKGDRVFSPPGLIIQDELHLISGPLGSTVGVFEAIIQELCTDRRNGRCVRPKIVSATATIRRYVDQIAALYARDDVVLFPPPGLDAGDSFFSRYARSAEGSLQPGRMYVGIHAPGLGSQLTAVVRSFSALLQAAYQLPAGARDPWWTLFVFFNTLRELGTSLSLFQSDIPDYAKVMRNRKGLSREEVRLIWHILELTSRLRNDEVPRAIESLEVRSTSAKPQPVDVCLASSIIEVGIDVDRLSLMAVVSQPKTTSQYIQVTGRVGRSWWERPGLVATIYSAARPRDRSHFEKFRSYHERLYAQVEPTSVTPFSPPALERSLHAAMIAHVRQSGEAGLSPYPFPEDLVERFAEVMRERITVVDDEEYATLEGLLQQRADEWRRWERRRWEAGRQDDDPGLMYRAGSYVPTEWRGISWPVQQSMRTVDAECEATITRLYLNHEEVEDE